MPNSPKARQQNTTTPKQQAEQQRYSAQQRGYSKQWGRVKKFALAQQVADTADPWCRYCRKQEATTLDHILPPTRYHPVGSVAYEAMFWSERLWVPSCLPCNSLKQNKKPGELRGMLKDMVQLLLRDRGIEC